MKSKPIVCKSCIEHYEQTISSKEGVRAFNELKFGNTLNVGKMIYIKSRYDVSEFTRMYCEECQEEGLWVGLDSDEKGEFIRKNLALYLSDLSLLELKKIGLITTKENVPFLLLENNNTYGLKKIKQINGKLL
jgi:5S rRNA maturation endonuclease (ribonuclease M5)